MTKRAFGALTQHFVRAIVEPPILTDIGIDALRRTFITLVALFISIGLFLPRVFMKRYVGLSRLPSPEPYLRAWAGDTLFMLAFPMYIGGFAAVIVSPMLFPDETDYRVLTPLPLKRAELFAAKLTALLIVSVAAIVAVNSIASIAFPAVVGGRWATHGLGMRVLAHVTAACLASAWTVSAVMAVQGVCLLAVTEFWRHRVAATLQAGVFLLLLISVPFFVQLTGVTVTAATVASAPQMFLPPIWFLGVERWLLDGSAAAGYGKAAAMAGAAWLATIAIVIAAFVVLFRSAEALAGPAGGRSRSAIRVRIDRWIRARLPVPGPEAAVIGFAVRGLLRSRLHQFAFVIVIGCGLALLAGQIASIVEGRSLIARPREAIAAAIAAPLLLTLCVTIGLRAAFLLPLNRGAGWVFRLVDDPRTRPVALNGVASVFSIGAVLPALALAVVLQPPLLGLTMVPCAMLTALAGLTLVELVLMAWRRIPYACTYLPGKRHVTYTVAVLLGAYALFVATGAQIVLWSVLHPARLLFTGGLLIALFGALRRARLRTWGAFPLEFVDEHPAAVTVIPLGPYA